MKRSDFLAIIPSLSAIPFIGKDIVKKSDRIEIFSPEEMHRETTQHEDVVIHVVKKGRILATGYIKELTVNASLIDTTCMDNGGAKTFMRGAYDMEMLCALYPTNDNALYDNLYDINTGWSNRVYHNLSKIDESSL
jgi:hypothetical protein